MTLTMKNSDMKLEYIAETTRGSEPASGQLHRPSDGIENVSLTGSKNSEIIYTITDYDGQDTVYGMEEYTLTFDYYLQRHGSSGHTIDKSVEYYALTRDSSGLLTPLTFYITTDSNTTFMVNGGMINNFTLTPEETRIRCSVEVLGHSAVTAMVNYSSMTASAAVGTSFEQFQGCACTRTGSFAAGVSGFSMTIANNVDRIPIIGSSSPTMTVENFEALSGSVNILVNDGGAGDWGDFAGNCESNLVFDSGTSSTAANRSMKWTFANAAFTEVPITFTKDSAYIESGISWGAETVTLAAYS